MTMSFFQIGNNGGLPDSFARLHVSFSLPLLDELLSHMYMVCALGFPTPQKGKLKLKFIRLLWMTCRFVSQKNSTIILFYWKNLSSLVMEIFVKPLCNFSSGSRVKNIKKVCYTYIAITFVACGCLWLKENHSSNLGLLLCALIALFLRPTFFFHLCWKYLVACTQKRKHIVILFID